MELSAPLVILGAVVLVAAALLVVALVWRSRATRDSVNTRIDVVGEQPAAESWLREALNAATETTSGRWSYDIYPLGVPGGRYELRTELASPRRDARITVRLEAPASSGLFAAEDPLRVQIATEQSPPAPTPLRWLAGPYFTEADGVRRRLARRIRAQSRPIPEPGTGVPRTGETVGADSTPVAGGSPSVSADGADPAVAPGPTPMTGSGTPAQAFAHPIGSNDVPGAPRPGGGGAYGPGVFPPRPRRPRRRLGPVVVLVVVVLAAVLAGLWYTGRLDGLLGGSPSPSATKPSKTPVVVKGTKPKSAKACRATASTNRSPKHSATGNAMTTCALAESVRTAYITKDEPGQANVKIEAYDRTSAKRLTLTCGGRTTVKCSGGGKLVYLY